MTHSLETALAERAYTTKLPTGDTGQLIDLDDILRIAAESQCPGWRIEALALKANIIPVRYLRNMDEVSVEQQRSLLESSIAQVGLGGLGGSLLEMFLRAGIGRIRGADGDHFEESNLNRQALSSPSVLNTAKANVAKQRTEHVNPSVEFTPVTNFLDESTLPEFLHGATVAIDALGGLKTRQALQQAASQIGIPLVTGALAGWTGYISVVQPGMAGPADIMGRDNAAEEKLGCPAPAVNLIASIMASETIKLLTDSPSPLAGKMLLVDLRDMTFETISL